MLYPLNKYLVVDLIEEIKKESGVLVPDGVNIGSSAFKLVKIREPNTSSKLSIGLKILVHSHMIEQADFFGETYYLVLENHVVGFYEKD